MVNREPTFRHHLFEVSIAKRISQVPAHAQNYDFLLEVAATEHRRSALAHLFHPIRTASNRFATLPNRGLLQAIGHEIELLNKSRLLEAACADCKPDTIMPEMWHDFDSQVRPFQQQELVFHTIYLTNNRKCIWLLICFLVKKL